MAVSDNDKTFSLGDVTKQFVADSTALDGVVSAQINGNSLVAAGNSYGCGGSSLGSPPFTTTTTPNFTFTEPVKAGCEYHEIDKVEVDEDGDLTGYCVSCDAPIIVDVGMLSDLSARVLDRLAEAIGDKDTDKARVALGELAPQIREARKTLERIDRMMGMLEKVAKVS